jgi:hypothetical protein
MSTYTLLNSLIISTFDTGEGIFVKDQMGTDMTFWIEPALRKHVQRDWRTANASVVKPEKRPDRQYTA